MLLRGKHMNLREYLFLKRMTVKEFSEIVECSRNHISQIINSGTKPSKRLAKDIERATNGEVKAEDLLNPKEK